MAAALLCWTACAPLDGHAGPYRVVDGDGLRQGEVSYRIAGIDAPELGQPCIRPSGAVFDCGAVVAQLLQRDVAAHGVSCVDLGERSYNRVVARCEMRGRDLGAELIASGRARAHPDHATAQYVALEREAAAAGVGLWAHQMQAPWDYRRSGRDAARAAVVQDQACPVKGNISRQGERIYHVAGQRDYAQTRISPARGERCFDTERAARQAGWRRALR